MNRKKIDTVITAYNELKEKALNIFADKTGKDIPKIIIGMATCGKAAGADEIDLVFREILEERNLEADIIHVGCIGHCYAEPIVIIENPGFPPILYYNVTSGKAKILVKSFLEKGDPHFEYVLGAMEDNDLIPTVSGFPRFSMEERIVMELCGHIDPENIYDYIRHGGYSSIPQIFSMGPGEIVEEVKRSGLRGRGGAGFPAGLKLEMAMASRDNEKYLICNADEGDPGAYMDRTIIESNPHQLIEGMLISAYALGASRGIVYVRHEYPLAVKMLEKAFMSAEENGLLGKNILNSGFDFTLSVFQGSGAFVCGEETALIQSMEGRRGCPVNRPPYPSEKGLNGKPTLIHNVKTLSTLPSIIRKGSGWFSEIGSEGSRGTAIFSIVGDVLHAGLVEIPMGVTIRSLIFDICGGIPHHKKLKAVQIGGPSGGCLPDECLDTPIDFDSLREAGAMMGSGGMVVMDEDTCMVDVARYFLEFTQSESCGKCTFCRVGTKHLLTILERITEGEGREGDIELLEQLSMDIKAGSLCGLGKTAPNPVLTTIKYFRDEYEAHIKEKRCPSLSCRSLTAFYIDLDKCARGCDACVGSCPVDCIFTTRGRKKGIDQENCVKCGECVTACPDEYDAVIRISPISEAPIVEKLEDAGHKK